MPTMIFTSKDLCSSVSAEKCRPTILASESAFPCGVQKEVVDLAAQDLALKGVQFLQNYVNQSLSAPPSASALLLVALFHHELRTLGPLEI